MSDESTTVDSPGGHVRVEVIETAGLGDRSYLVSAEGVAAVIDPQRDIDRVLSRAAGLRITHVLETHLHNDYVTGGLELSRVTSADYVVPQGDQVGYPALRVSDGDVVDVGPFRLRVLHTPGHTREHVSYVLDDGVDGTAGVGVFTGGSMLFDATGRTDLLGDEHTHELTTAQFHSVRRLAEEVPDEAEVYPTHGFGSFCAASSVGRDASTVGEQRRSNPALTQDEQAYVTDLLRTLSDYPAYYAHMGVINRDGPDPVDLTPPARVDPAEVRRRIEAGEWVVDLRHRTAFAAGHLRGSLGFELSDSFVTYLGWLYAWGTPITLIGDGDSVARARRELARIGVDEVTGTADADVLAGPTPLRSYPVSDFAGLRDALAAGGDEVTVLDVRRSDEFADGHVRGAVNIPVHELSSRRTELDRGAVWVHCASGYRASVAASVLDRQGVPVVLIDDAFGHAEDAGLTG